MADRTRIEQELIARGVSAAFAEAVAPNLVRVADRLLPEIYDALLTGISLAHVEHRKALDVLRTSPSELEEVEALLGAFGDELHKLDEALETLAAYASRLRTRKTTDDESSETPEQRGAPPDEWLH